MPILSTDKNNIIKSGFYSIVQVLTATLSYAAIYILVVAHLGKEQLGIWSILMTIPAALTLIGSGVSGCILRFLPIYHTENSCQKITQLIFNGLVTNAIMSGLLVLLGITFAKYILSFLFNTTNIPEFYFLLFYISLAIFLLNFINSVILISLDGLQLMAHKNKVLITASLFVCFSAIVLVKLYGLKGLFYAQLFQSVAVSVFGAYLLSKTNLLKIKFMKLDFATIKIFFGYGITFQYISIFTLLFDPITKYFLNRYFNLSIVGTFDIANRIVLQVRQLIVNAILVIIPVVTKQSEANKLDTKIFYGKALRGALLMSIICYCLLISGVLTFMGLVIKSDQIPFTLMLILLAFAQIFNIISVPGYAILTGLGKLRPLLFSHIMATGLNFIFFIGLAYVANVYTIVLPTFLAISLSSLYIIYYFRKNFIDGSLDRHKEDYPLYILSIIFTFFCTIGTIYSWSNYTLLLFLSIQMITLAVLVLKNNFIRELIKALFKRLPTNYET